MGSSTTESKHESSLIMVRQISDLADRNRELESENARLREVVDNIVMTGQWAKNRLDKMADDCWHGIRQSDGREWSRSIMGAFHDFEEAARAATTLNKGEAGDG